MTAACLAAPAEAPLTLLNNQDWDGDVIAIGCEGGDACAECLTCCDECCPLWTVRFGVMQLQRAAQQSATLIVPTAGPGVIANAADFQYSGAVIPDLSVIRRLAGVDFNVPAFKARAQFL